jgi:hypothetical protein
MDLQQYKKLIPANFSDNSRVWIYQSNRKFSSEEIKGVALLLKQFVSVWRSHGDPVKGFADLFYDQFIVIIADESATAVGGCSTDSSVHIIKLIESKYNVSLFDRQLLAFEINEQIELLPLSQLKIAIKEGLINANTLYFNNTITMKLDFITNWIQPVEWSWLSARLNFSAVAS